MITHEGHPFMKRSSTWSGSILAVGKQIIMVPNLLPAPRNEPEVAVEN